jgi:hypothetical protein
VAETNPDALLTASQGAAYCGVSLAVFCNWSSRGYRDLAGEHVYLRPATYPDGRVRKDGRGCKFYRLLDITAAEAATSASPHRPFPVAA